MRAVPPQSSQPLTRPPKSQRASDPHVRHHENIRPSLSLFLLRPCGHRGLKEYRAFASREVVRVHAARNFETLFIPAARTRPLGGKREVKAAPFRREFRVPRKVRGDRDYKTRASHRDAGERDGRFSLSLHGPIVRGVYSRVRDKDTAAVT